MYRSNNELTNTLRAWAIGWLCEYFRKNCRAMKWFGCTEILLSLPYIANFSWNDCKIDITTVSNYMIKHGSTNIWFNLKVIWKVKITYFHVEWDFHHNFVRKLIIRCQCRYLPLILQTQYLIWPHLIRGGVIAATICSWDDTNIVIVIVFFIQACRPSRQPLVGLLSWWPVFRSCHCSLFEDWSNVDTSTNEL